MAGQPSCNNIVTKAKYSTAVQTTIKNKKNETDSLFSLGYGLGSQLVEEQVFTSQQMQSIRAKPTNFDQANEVFTLLMQHTEKFGEFLAVLKKHYSAAYDILYQEFENNLKNRKELENLQ